jgi:exosortase A
MPNAIPLYLKDPKSLAKIGGCALCLAILYFGVFSSLVADWISLPDFSHGFLIPFVSLYLLWQRADELEKIQPAPSNLGLPVVIFGLFLLVVGNLASESFTMRVSFLIVLAGIILFLLGRQYLKALAFPICYLIFMIPIPSILLQKITFPMQLFASRVATFSLQMLDIPVLREGNVIQLAQTTLEVAEACSGIRSLISLLALGVIFAYFTQRTLWKQVVLVIACFPIAILVNALRVSATGILAHYYGIEMAQGFFHEFSGFLLFAAAFALMFAVGYALGKINPPKSEND